jgi:hypothetical protein
MDAFLSAAFAAAVIAAGCQAGTRAAHAWHRHRTVRDASSYLRHPQLRDVIDHFHQPRKETP